VPAFGYAYAYVLPADWIRCVAAVATERGGGALDYRLEGRQLLSDSAAVYLSYVRRVEDVSLMPPDFRAALASLLARELALPLAQSNSLEEKLEARFRTRLRRARSSDGLEDRLAPLAAGAWVEARRG
jgi:hypothetical protein